MRKPIAIFLFISCAFSMHAQVWTKLIDSASRTPCQFYCATEDPVKNILYLGGDLHDLNKFRTKGVAQFDGSNFDTLGTGIDDFASQYISATIVRSMTMFQNKLYVFGDFKKTGKYYCNNIGRWNGTSWDTVNFRPHGDVWFSDTYNNELYVAGSFDSIGGIKCNSVSKFDGNVWHDIGHPISPNVITAFKIFNGVPYIAGQVTQSSSSANLSYFDGTQWIAWVGVSGDNSKYIAGMTVIDTMLYVYGRFNSIAGTNCKGLAAYNGKNWYGFGTGLSSSSWETIHNIQKINGELYVTGIFDKIEGIGNSNLPHFATSMAKFDGQKWCLVSPPFDNSVLGMVKYKNNIYGYGAFWIPENDSLQGFAKFNGGYTGATCSNTVTINMSAVGLNEIIAFDALKIYPNPTKGLMTVELQDLQNQELKLMLFNTIGKSLDVIEDIETKYEIDLSPFPAGIYYLRVESNKEQKVFKIAKE